MSTDGFELVQWEEQPLDEAGGLNFASLSPTVPAPCHRPNMDLVPIAYLDFSDCTGCEHQKEKEIARPKAKPKPAAKPRSRQKATARKAAPKPKTKKIRVKKTTSKKNTQPRAKIACAKKRPEPKQSALEKEEEKLSQKTPVVEFEKECNLSLAFDWPTRLMNCILCGVQQHPNIHVRLHTEFSGAGTAEFAMQALSGVSHNKITSEFVSAADWDKVPQLALSNNLSGDTHIFSDIGHVMSPSMKDRVERLVPVQILISKADVLKAVGSSEYMGRMIGSGSEGDEQRPTWNVHGLFKKSKKKPSHPTEFGGVLKARGLGTALKDYILVSEAIRL